MEIRAPRPLDVVDVDGPDEEMSVDPEVEAEEKVVEGEEAEEEEEEEEYFLLCPSKE